MSNYDFGALVEHIVARSQAKDFDSAVKEWECDGRIKLEETECPCGVSITERCYIRNKLTGESTFVGNKCIKRFFDIDLEQVFVGLRAIERDITAKPTKALVDHARKFGWLTLDEAITLRSQLRPRRIPFAASQTRLIELNKRILSRCTDTTTTGT